MKKKNPKRTIIFLVFLMIAGAGLDIWTTFRTEWRYFEANPLWTFSESLSLLLLVKIGIVGLLSWALLSMSFKKESNYFYFLSLFVFLIALQGIAALNNYAFHDHLTELAQTQNTTTSALGQEYINENTATERAINYGKSLLPIYVFICLHLYIFSVYDKTKALKVKPPEKEEHEL